MTARFATVALTVVGCLRDGSQSIPGNSPEPLAPSVQVPVTIGSFAAGLSLSGTLDSLMVLVAGCASGYSRSFQTGWDSNDLMLVEGDSGCAASVVDVTYDGEVYTLDGASFNTVLGAANPFRSSSGRALSVIVSGQLSGSITPSGESISFRLIESQRGTRQVLTDLGFNIMNVVALTPIVAESALTASFLFTREGSLASPLTVGIALGGTAIPDEDYVAPASQITFAADSATATLDIALIDDTAREFDETLTVTALASEEAIPYGSPGLVTIQNDDSNLPITGLVAYLRPDGFSAPLGTVEQWLDASVNGANATQTVVSAQPTLMANGIGSYDAASFDGNDSLGIPDNTSINTGGPFDHKTIAVVFKTGANVTSDQVLYEQGFDKRGLNIYLSNGRLYFNGWNLVNDDGGLTTPWGQSYVSAPVVADTTYVARLVFSATAGTISGFVDGIGVGQVTGVGRLFSQSGQTSIGYTDSKTYLHSGRKNNGLYFTGRIAEILHYNAQLSESQGQSIDETLLAKYGESLPLLASVSMSPNVVTEGASTIVTVSRTYASPSALVVNLLSSGSATLGSDYDPIPTSVTIPANAVQASFELFTTDDVDEEVSETVTIEPAPSADYGVGASATLTIEDNDSFNPPAGNVAWFNAGGYLTLVAGKVSHWSDFRGGLVTASQLTTSAQPTFSETGLNNRPALVFDGSDSMIIPSNGNIDAGGPYAAKTLAFAFATGVDVSSRQVLWHEGDRNRGLAVYVDAGSLYFNVWNLKSDDALSPWKGYISVPISASSDYQLLLVFDRVGGELRGTLNGSPITSFTGQVGNLYSHSSNTGIGVNAGDLILHTGARDRTKRYFKGTIAEIFYYNEVLAASDEDALEAHLMDTYLP